MKRLYKIIILFFLIFLVGIYFTVRSINTTLSTEEKTEIISVAPLSSLYTVTKL
ncbi:hypothetical protein [Urechidicola vernalis]|uniref:Uncharacterized protein n=1 Tax=Urechidicola vernalis TaxID=3075600 RepID=A0ABU2Y601_9FLAO|nr:hypothetical protein [Urechidicola sp. P050]MDT0553629.1 hypothetical protein [Urechidicola sp. P050]